MDDLAQARRRCVAVRRMLTRARRRNRPCRDLEDLYRKSHAALCKSIKKAKAESWDALLQTIDDDLWGLPNRVVMDRLRHSGSTMSESLEPDAVEGFLDELFPIGDIYDPVATWQNGCVLDAEYRVMPDEVKSAIRGRRRGGCSASGPDGLSLTLWKCIPASVVRGLAKLYSLCLESGKIPAS